MVRRKPTPKQPLPKKRIFYIGPKYDPEMFGKPYSSYVSPPILPVRATCVAEAKMIYRRHVNLGIQDFMVKSITSPPESVRMIPPLEGDMDVVARRHIRVQPPLPKTPQRGSGSRNKKLTVWVDHEGSVHVKQWGDIQKLHHPPDHVIHISRQQSKDLHIVRTPDGYRLMPMKKAQKSGYLNWSILSRRDPMTEEDTINEWIMQKQ